KRSSSNLHTIDDMLRLAERGRLCLMMTSDATKATALAVAFRVLGLDTFVEFNNVLREMLVILREIEKGVVSNSINDLSQTSAGQSNGDDSLLTALRTHFATISIEPMPHQEDFEFDLQASTGELDTERGNRLQSDIGDEHDYDGDSDDDDDEA